MKRLKLLAAVLLLGAATMAGWIPTMQATPAGASGPTSLGRTPWQMYRPSPITGVGPYSTHGQVSEYDHAPTVPAADAVAWGPAPNGSTIGFSVPSRLSQCWTQLDFAFFQTLVDIPTGTTLSSFTIAFSGMDDGARVSIYNSANPSGLVIPGSYVFLGGSGTTNLASYVVAGETNRVVVTQVDDCPTGNNLQSATVVLNGTVVVANQAPTVSASNASVTVNEGQTAANTGSYSDADAGDGVTITPSRGTVTKTGTNSGAWNWSLATTDGPAQSGPVTMTADDGHGHQVSTSFTLTVNNVAPSLGVNVGATNTVYYVDWTAANPGAGTASGVITLPDTSTVNVTFDALNPDSSHSSFFGAQTSGGTNFWSPSAPYISTEVPNAPPTPDILQLSGGNATRYKVTLSQPIVDPIMAIVSLGSGGNTMSYNFDSPFAIVSQGVGFWGGCSTCLVQLPNNVLQGTEGHGTIKFLGTFSTFSWTVPNPEVWHGFTFAIRTTGQLGNTSVNEGDTATNSGTWSDPGVNDAVSLTASAGTVTKNANGTWNWSLNTTDGPAESQTITITATDKDGASTSKSFPIVVKNVAPTGTFSHNGPVNEGSSFTLTLSNATDPSSVDAGSLQFAFDCGSGYGALGSANTAICATTDNGTRNVKGKVQDKDGGVTEYTRTVQVNNVAPSVTAGGDATLNQGDTLTRSGAFTDPGSADTWTATVNYGDGGGATPLTLAGDHSFSLSHAYLTLGTFTVLVQVVDDDSGAGTATFSVTVKDVTPPAVVCGTADGLWHGADVSIACTATDGGSGLANPADASFSLSTSVPNGTETANASTGSRAVCDNASNCTTAGPIAGNKVDKKAPVAAPAQSPAANGAGWNNTDVTVTWNWSDGGSGIDPAACTTSSTSTGEGSITLTASCTDRAGNTGSASYTVKVDKTLPTISGDRTPAANGFGWNNTDVTVSFTCADEAGGSGLASCSTPTTLTAEGAGQAVTGTAKDTAGNTATTTVGGISIDKTKPVAAPTATPAANGAGWNKADVTVAWNWSDGLSGVDPAACTTSSTSTGEGTITLTASCTDKAGNTGSASYTVKVDKTAPVAYNEFDPGTKDVVVKGRDGGSGVASVSCTTAPVKWGDGDDDKDEPGAHHLSDDKDKGKDDDASKVELRTCTVTDVAGNTTVLVEKVKKAGHEVKATMLTVQYNGGAVITLPKNSKKFEWSVTKTGSLKELEQKLTIGQGAGRQNVEAKYEAEKNKTTIEKELPKPETKVTLPGLVLLRLVTDGSGLKIEY